MSRILITGGAGFIGSHTANYLTKNGHEVFVYDFFHQYILPIRPNFLENMNYRFNHLLKDTTIVRGGTNNKDQLRRQIIDINPNCIIHLAALVSIPYSYRSPLSYIHTNILGTTNLLEAGRKNKIKHFIHTSTSEVYGSAKYVPMDENHPLNAQSPYAASKISADQICLSFHKSFNMPITIIRPFNTFGPRQSLRAVIPTILFQASIKNVIKIGNTSSKRDFTFVDDTAQGIYRVSTKEGISGEIMGCSQNGETGPKFRPEIRIQRPKIGQKHTEKIRNYWGRADTGPLR